MKPEQSKPPGLAEILHRDPDDAAVVGVRRGSDCLLDRVRLDQGLRSSGFSGPVLGGAEARLGLSCQPFLTALLGSLQAGDLILDRGEQSLALCELALDRAALRRLVGDDLDLSLLGALEPPLALDRLCAEALDLPEHARVLRGNAIDGVDPVEQVVDRLGREDDLERAAAAAALVERDEARRQVRLSGLETRSRDRQMVGVRPQLTLDPVELDVREVVRLDRKRQLPVDLLDLGEDALRLGLLRRDGRIGGRGSHGCQRDGHEKCRQHHQDQRRLSRARADYAFSRSTTRGSPVGARSVTSGAP